MDRRRQSGVMNRREVLASESELTPGGCAGVWHHISGDGQVQSTAVHSVQLLLSGFPFARLHEKWGSGTQL